MKHKKLLILAVILVNLIVIGVTAYDEFRSPDRQIGTGGEQVRWVFLLPAAGAFVCAFLIETAKFVILMHHSCGFRRLRVSLMAVLLGRYYDCITPSGIGGQPYQIYYLSQHGIPSSKSAVIALTSFTALEYGFILMSAAVFLLGRSLLKLDIIRISSWVGLACYAIVPTLILICAFFPGFSQRLSSVCIRFLHRIRILKNADALEERFHAMLIEYSDTLRSLLRMPAICAVLIALSVCYEVCLCSIPYFVLKAFGGSMDFLTAFCSTVAVTASVTFIPVPGSSGVAEGAFYAVFSSLTDGNVFLSMLAWRFFMFYIFIIIGLTVYIRKVVMLHIAEKKRPAAGRDASSGS